MVVLVPRSAPMRPYNLAHGPQAQNLSTLWFTATKGEPRYEDLYSVRALSLSHSVSIPIDTILQQVTTTPWAIAPDTKNPTSKHEAVCEALTEFFDGGFNTTPMTFDGLCREWLNDILSIDAGVLELVPDESGFLAEIYPRDGATFTKSPDQYGRLPAPGSEDPAYYQVGAQGGIFGDPGYGQQGLPSLSSITQSRNLSGLPRYRAITPIPFSRDQIVWTEENPSTWRTYGFGRVQKVRAIIEIILNQDAANLKYFCANEIPEGVLNLVDMSSDSVERFREYWREEVEGQAHKLPIIGVKNAQWVPFRANLQDLQFLESQRWYHHLVWMTFGLNPNEVGDLADVNRSTAQEQAETVWRRTTVPLLELLSNAINRFILPKLEAYWDVDGEVKFVWDPDNPILRRQKRAEQREDLRLGLTTPNQILQEGGRDPVPWGDIPYDVYQSIARTQPEWFCSEILGMDNAPEPAYGGGLYLSSPDPIQKAAEDLRKGRGEEEPPEWRSRIETLSRQVGATLADELAPLKAALEEAWPAEVPDGGIPPVDVQAIVDRIDLTDTLLQTTDDARIEAMQHGADLESRRLEGELEKRVGGGMIVRLRPMQHDQRVKKFDVTQTIAYRLIRERAARNMRHVDQTVKDRVRDCLSRVVGEGGNVNDAWLALQETIGGLSSDHARVIARTEIMGAQRYGKQALAESIPDIAGGKSWHSRKVRGRTRPWHAAMDGVVVPVSESFEVPATGAKGQPRDYPKRAFIVGEDQPYNCMCDQRIVLKDDLPADPAGLRSIHCLSISSPPSPRQQEVLAKHGQPGETIAELLERTDRTMSRNQTAEHLGISKATLYEWRKQEGLE